MDCATLRQPTKSFGAGVSPNKPGARNANQMWS